MSQTQGKQEAIQRAVEKLSCVDLTARCALLGLPAPENCAGAGVVSLRVFGRDYRLHGTDFKVVNAANGEPAKEGDQILILHYLLHDAPLQPTGTLITFREFPGGRFYWEPFLSRTALPLLQRIGNDPALLRKNLDRFDWEPQTMGDLGAKIHALGKFALHLAYHCGDDELPPAVDLLFDSCVKRVYGAEDAAAMASRICLGLL